MFANEYYCLVAGLKEYSLDADTKGFDARAIVSEILEGVTAADAREVRLRPARGALGAQSAGQPDARGAGGGAESSEAAA